LLLQEILMKKEQVDPVFIFQPKLREQIETNNSQ